MVAIGSRSTRRSRLRRWLAPPPGLTGKIAGVGKCSDAALQAAASNPSGAAEIANPSCPASSEVGTVQAGSGVGADPIVLPGKAYLTGPYEGAPLSLAVIVPAVAGPFDLGNVVVRSALYIDPHDAHVTAVSDLLPTIVDAKGRDGGVNGFPIRMRSVNVDMNRKEFVLNPTSCNVMSVTGQELSTAGQTAALSDRFQAGGCRELSFKPGFAVSTQARTSKANGASLTVKVAQKPGEANIHKVDVQLPLALPARLSTLNKACTAAVFEANPASCPKESNVGTAVAHTPILAQPLTGPAYLVSHGGAAFPDVVMVLQGEGITIDLVGNTNIRKGVTYSRFESVPDAPVSSFELTLPEGPYSVLATNLPAKAKGSLCGARLLMGTTITGQNGAVVKQKTKIAVTGCPKLRRVGRRRRKTPARSSLP